MLVQMRKAIINLLASLRVDTDPNILAVDIHNHRHSNDRS
jgi:hypothetical protein